MNVFASICFFVIAGCCLLAALVPAWFSCEINSTTVGPEQVCQSGLCTGTNYAASRNWCNADVEQWKSRDKAVHAFTWLGMAMCAITFIVTLVALPNKCVSFKKVAPIVAGCAGFAIVCFIIALAIWGNTFWVWLCGEKVCDIMKRQGTAKYCDFGGSVAAELIALLLSVLVIVTAIVGMVMSGDGVGAGLVCFALTIVTTVLSIVAAATKRWLVAFQDNFQLGMFWGCTNEKAPCETIDYSILRSFPLTWNADRSANVAVSCPRDDEATKARMNAVGALFIVAFVVALVFGILMCVMNGSLAFILGIVGLVLVAILAFVALIIFGHTFNNYLTCGNGDFNDMVGRSTGSNCGYSFAAIAAIIALLLAGLLLVFLVLQKCGIVADPNAVRAIGGGSVGVDGGAGANLSVGAPSGHVNVAGPSGAIGVGAPSANMNVAAPSGGINVAAPSGGINVAAPSGGINVAAPSGSVKVAAPSGGLNIGAPSGSIGVGAPSGSIGVAAPSGGLNFGAPSGSIGVGAPSGSIGFGAPSGSVAYGGQGGFSAGVTTRRRGLDFAGIKAKFPIERTPEKLKERNALFETFDEQANDRLSLSDTQTAVARMLKRELEGTNCDLTRIVERAFKAAATANKGAGQTYEAGSAAVERLEFRLLLVYLRNNFELWEMFDQIDSGDDNRISVEEFKKALPLLSKWGVAVTDVAATYREIDPNNNGVDFDEFSAWALKKSLDMDGQQDV